MVEPTKTEEQQIEELRRELEALKSKEVGGTSVPTPLEIKLATGQVVKGTPDEALKTLTKMVEDNSAAVRQREAETRELRELLVKQRQQTSGEPVAFDPKQYFEIWERNPQDALLYQLQALFGFETPQEVQGTLQEMYNSSQEWRDAREIGLFYGRCPDYLPTNENAEILLTRLNEQGREPTADNYEMVFRQLTAEGRLKPASVPGATGEGAAQSPPTTPPPQIGVGAGEVSPDWIRQFESLSTADQEKLLREKGLL